MYGQPGQALGNTARDVSAPKQARPTVNNTHQDAIKNLGEVINMLDVLLAKVRGAHPEENAKQLEEMPSVLSNAAKLNQLSYHIRTQVCELHDVIGE